MPTINAITPTGPIIFAPSETKQLTVSATKDPDQPDQSATLQAQAFGEPVPGHDVMVTLRFPPNPQVRYVVGAPTQPGDVGVIAPAGWVVSGGTGGIVDETVAVSTIAAGTVAISTIAAGTVAISTIAAGTVVATAAGTQTVAGTVSVSGGTIGQSVGQGKTLTWGTINLTSGSVSLVNPGTGTAAYIVGITLSAGTAGIIQFLQGAGAAALSGPIHVDQYGGFVDRGQPSAPVLKSAAGSQIYLQITSGIGTVGGYYSYFAEA